MPQNPQQIDWSGLPDQAGAKSTGPSIDWSSLPDKEEPKDQPSTLSNYWHAFTDPLTTWFSDTANKAANYITDPNNHLARIAASIVAPTTDPNTSVGLAAGGMQGAGRVADSLTSRASLITAILGGAETAAGKAGMESLVPLFNTGTKVASAPFAVHGAAQAVSPDSTLEDRLAGIGEFAGGAAGMFHAPVEGNLGKIGQAATEVPPTTAPPAGPAGEALIKPTLRGDLTDLYNEVQRGTPPPVEDTSLAAFVQKMKEADQIHQQFGLDRVSKTVPREGDMLPEGQPIVQPSQQPDIDALINELNNSGDMSVVNPEDTTFQNNASGTPGGGSLEEINRQSSMKQKGQQFVVYDRMGNERPIIGVDAQDYTAKPGETFGVKNADGSFTKYDDNGGKVPAPSADIQGPSASLIDRPLETRTTEELENRISDLEQKPNLNAGGKRALDQMRTEVQKRRMMEEQNFDENPDIPSRARTEGGGVKIGADVKSLGKILGTSLYKGDMSTIATKELLQNSLDSIRDLGNKGRVHVDFDHDTGHVTVTDNGKGMTPAEVQSVFTDLGSSGKRSDENAIGGFGLAKAAPLLGGEHSETITTARDPLSGKLMRTTFAGTPDELLEGVGMHSEEVPEGTPTGTSVKVRVPKSEWGGYGFYDAGRFVDRISKYSDIPGKIIKTTASDKGMTVGERLAEATKNKTGSRLKSGLKELGVVENPSGKVSLYQPSDTRPMEGSLNIHYRNKGMYQSTKNMFFGKEMPGVPADIIADIDPRVPEGHADYPFTANRESLRGSVEQLVSKYIDENVLKPAQKKYAAGLQELYDNMPSVTTKGGDIIYFHDTNGKFTPEEFQKVISSPEIHAIGEQIHDIIEQTTSRLNELGQMNPAYATWPNKVAKVGMIFDEKLKGIYIPDPSSGGSKAAILINPLGLMEKKTPDESAIGFVHTILHELAHADVGPHDENFAIRLSDISERFGARRTMYASQKFLETVAPETIGTRNPTPEYSPEIQELLSGYSEARGRASTTKDILSSTGIESKATPPSEGGNGRNSNATREGTSIILKNANPESVKRILQSGYVYKGMRDDGTFEFTPGKSGPLPTLEAETNRKGARPTPANAMRQLAGGKPATPIKDALISAYNFPRTVMASMDFSAPLRQGLPLIHKKQFWTSLDDMFRAFGSKETYDAIQSSIMEKPLFKPRIGPGGKPIRSFAEEAGVKMTDLNSLSTREESRMSQFASKIPGLSHSERAYTAFLNKLRADTFESLIEKGKVFGADGETNLPLAREIAEYVNNATGRGSLGSLEKSAVALNNMLFSPRLIAARLRMLNPMYYITANPFVRKEALKSLLAVAAVGNVVTQLGKMAGGTVESDPASSDFGKLKLGNIRVDPYAGFQQYIVAANRLLTQREVSSTTGKEFDLSHPSKPFDPNNKDLIERFVRGKIHPVLGFAWSLLDAQKEMSGQKMNFSAVNPLGRPGNNIMDNAVAQRFIPIVWQDLYSIYQEDPSLLSPMKDLTLGGLSTFGMGIQAYGGQPHQ